VIFETITGVRMEVPRDRIQSLVPARGQLVGWGYAWGGEDPWLSNDPLIMLGGEYRVGPRTKLLTENFFVPGEAGALLAGGMGFFGERLSVDFGIGALVGFDSDGIPWFPLLNFVWNFGGGR